MFRKLSSQNGDLHVAITPQYVNPSFGDELIHEFSWWQILGEYSVARLRSNRGWIFYVVRANQQSVSKQRNCKRVYNNRCFPWGLCRVLIREVTSDWHAHTGPRFALSVQNSVRVRLHNQILQETGRNPKSQKIQVYVQLDKEKPCIGSTRGLNLAADRPTTVQVCVHQWTGKCVNQRLRCIRV
jgi:hypothetical protein